MDTYLYPHQDVQSIKSLRGSLQRFRIGEAIGTGLAIEFPPAAIYEGYKAVEDFKKFGALAEESERLRDLADHWGKD